MRYPALLPNFYLGGLFSHCFKSSLCILDTCPLSDTWFAKLLSPSVGRLLILLTVYFAEQFFILMESASGVLSKKSLLNLRSPRFSFTLSYNLVFYL